MLRTRSMSFLGNAGLGGFTVVQTSGGPVVCPDDNTELGNFQGLQRAINSYLRRHLPLEQTINVDGLIGPATLRKSQAVWNDMLSKYAPVGFLPANVGMLANDPRTYATGFAIAADTTPNFSADSDTRAPCPGGKTGSSTKPATTTTTTTTTKPSGMSGGTKLALGLGLAAGAAVLLLNDDDSRKRRRR